MSQNQNPPVSPAFEQLADWSVFYRIFFPRSQKICSSVAPPYCPGFDQLILLLGGITAKGLVKASLSKFPMSIPPEVLAEIEAGMPSERRMEDDYAVWAKNKPEPEWRSTESRQLFLSRLPRIGYMTLSERLVLGLFHFWKKREHLDRQLATLCLPTQCKSGKILEVTCAITDRKKGIFGFRRKKGASGEAVFISPWTPSPDDKIPGHIGFREVRYITQAPP